MKRPPQNRKPPNAKHQLLRKRPNTSRLRLHDRLQQHLEKPRLQQHQKQKHRNRQRRRARGEDVQNLRVPNYLIGLKARTMMNLTMTRGVTWRATTRVTRLLLLAPARFSRSLTLDLLRYLPFFPSPPLPFLLSPPLPFLSSSLLLPSPTHYLCFGFAEALGGQGATGRCTRKLVRSVISQLYSQDKAIRICVRSAQINPSRFNGITTHLTSPFPTFSPLSSSFDILLLYFCNLSH